MTKTQAFRAAHDFLERYLEERETIGLRTVLSGMLLDEKGRSADPGTLYTWVEALAGERGVDVEDYDDEDRPDHPTASVEEWFEALEGFIGYYAGTWKSDDRLPEIASDLDTVDLDRPDESRNRVWRAWRARCDAARE